MCGTGSVPTVLNAAEFPPGATPRYVPAEQMSICVRDVAGRDANLWDMRLSPLSFVRDVLPSPLTIQAAKNDTITAQHAAT